MSFSSISYFELTKSIRSYKLFALLLLRVWSFRHRCGVRLSLGQGSRVLLLLSAEKCGSEAEAVF